MFIFKFYESWRALPAAFDALYLTWIDRMNNARYKAIKLCVINHFAARKTISSV